MSFSNRSEFVRIKIVTVDREHDPTSGTKPEGIWLTFNEPWLKEARDIFDAISKL